MSTFLSGDIIALARKLSYWWRRTPFPASARFRSTAHNLDSYSVILNASVLTDKNQMSANMDQQSAKSKIAARLGCSDSKKERVYSGQRWKSRLNLLY